MNLSEAIRQGCKSIPRKTTGKYFDAENGEYMACALGAAYFTVVGLVDYRMNIISDVLRAEFPILSKELEFNEVPVCYQGYFKYMNGNTAGIQTIIANLNDYQDWTREQIADWVETLEYAHKS